MSGYFVWNEDKHGETFQEVVSYNNSGTFIDTKMSPKQITEMMSQLGINVGVSEYFYDLYYVIYDPSDDPSIVDIVNEDNKDSWIKVGHVSNRLEMQTLVDACYDMHHTTTNSINAIKFFLFDEYSYMIAFDFPTIRSNYWRNL